MIRGERCTGKTVSRELSYSRASNLSGKNTPWIHRSRQRLANTRARFSGPLWTLQFSKSRRMQPHREDQCVTSRRRWWEIGLDARPFSAKLLETIWRHHRPANPPDAELERTTIKIGKSIKCDPSSKKAPEQRNSKDSEIDRLQKIIGTRKSKTAMRVCQKKRYRNHFAWMKNETKVMLKRSL